jgi:hypothetical protein
MKHTINLLLSVLLLGIFSTGISAQGETPRTTGIYTDMSYNTEGGDVIGTEIFVVDTNRGYYVVFQSGEGEPSVPVVVPAKVSGSSIRFTLPSGTEGGTFTGTIGATQLIGSFSSNHQTIHLKRKASYWQ